MGKHTFTIQIDGQTVVEQCRGQVHSKSSTIHVGGLQNTVVVQESGTNAIRHLEVTAFDIATGNAGIDLLCPGSTVDLVLPVCLGIAQSSHGVSIPAVVGYKEILKGVCAKHIHLLGNGLERASHVNVHMRLGTCLTFLCGNDNHTV